MTAYDYRIIAGKDFNKVTNMITLRKTVDFTKRNMVAADTLIVFTLPQGFVYERSIVIPRIVEGSAATIELGWTGLTSGLVTAGSVNGTVNLPIVTAQSAVVGTWFITNASNLILTANGTIVNTKLEILLRGFTLPY